MKSLKIMVVAMVALLGVSLNGGAENSKNNRQTAVFVVEIHCDGCAKKIEGNIAFEKGVKDMVIDKKAQTVTITFDPSKTSVEKLSEAFAAIKKPVKDVYLVEEKK